MGYWNIFNTILSSALLFLTRNLSWFIIKIKVDSNFGTQQVSIYVLIFVVFGQIDDTIFEMMLIVAFFKRFDSVSFEGLLVEMRKLFGLLISLSRDQL